MRALGEQAEGDARETVAGQATGGPYDHREIERRWQLAWLQQPPPPAVPVGEPGWAYVIAGDPPLAQSMSLGRVRGYVIADAYARYLSARGTEVLFAPVFEAFGEAIEREALAHHATPVAWTERCRERIERQLRRLGCSVDFARASATSDPEVCRAWQVVFLALLQHGLVTRSRLGWRLRFARAEEEDADAEVARRLSELSAKGWRVTVGGRGGEGGPRGDPDTRLGPDTRGDPDSPGDPDLHPDAPREVRISQPTTWGTPIPVVHCRRCGMVPVPVTALPLMPVSDPGASSRTLGTATVPPGNAGAQAQEEQDEERVRCRCPRCSGRATRERETLTAAFGELWRWLAPCIRDTTGDPFADPALARLLPVTRMVCAREDGAAISAQRTGARALHDCGLLLQLPDGEPFAAVTVHETVNRGRPREAEHLDGLIRHMGADALRLTMLYGAAPGTVLTWQGHVREHCSRWLAWLWEYAPPRLQWLGEPPGEPAAPGPPGASGESPGASGDLSGVASGEPAGESAGATGAQRRAAALRGRLERWCATAVARVGENYQDLRMHRAARNVMALLERIEDFEARARARDGQLGAADRRALAQALLTAVVLLAPLTPHIAQELWRAAGQEGHVASAPWPADRPQR